MIRMTITQFQQFLFLTTWLWPAGVVLSGGASNPKDVEAAMFWAFVWLLCGIRLFAKKAWPFSLVRR